MSKLNRDWIVQSHGELVEVDSGLLTVEGSIVMPLGRFPRRMTVVALGDGGTAIWSPIPLREDDMARIEALGAPSFLIVPNAGHRLDVGAWHRRYPEAKVLAPPNARAAVDEAAPVDATGDIVNDQSLRFELVEGTSLDEFALVVTRGVAVTLILNDILSNVRHPRGLGAQIMARLFAFGVNRPRTSRTVRYRFVKDGGAVAAQFRRWANLPGLARIIVSHGDPIADHPAAALEHAAADLE